MRKNLQSLVWLLVAASSAVWTMPFVSQPQPVLLRGVVISEGNPLSGAPVDCRCGAFFAQAITEADGSFRLYVPPGDCELEARLDGYHTVEVKDVDLRERPSSTLVVALPRLISAEPETEVAGIAPVPPLRIGFKLTPANAANQIMTVQVTLANAGTAAVLVPTEPWLGDRLQNFFLRMNLRVASSDYGAAYSQWFGCLPPDGCRRLEPGESYSFPVTLVDSDQGSPKTYDRPGLYPFEASLYLVPAGTKFERTETVSTRRIEKIEDLR